MLIKTTIEGVGEKSIELKEIPSTPKLKVHFQSHPEYKGEYGFDWFRDYYETKLADQSKLQALKDEYTPCQILGEDYFVPWLTLMPNAAADLILKVELDEAVKIKKNAPGKIILPDHSGLIFSPAEIELSALRDKQEFEVNVSCRGILAADAKLDVTIDTDNQVVGKLNVLKNSVVPKINLRFVKVVVYPGQKYDAFPGEAAYLDSVLTKSDIRNFIKTRAFNQALIDVNIDPGDYVIELDLEKLPEGLNITDFQLVSNEGDSAGANLLKHLFELYEKKFASSSNTKDLLLFQSLIRYETYEGYIGGQSLLMDVASRSCIIYSDGIDRPADYVHELGHVLGCLHFFEDRLSQEMRDNINNGEEIKNRYRKKIKELEEKIVECEGAITTDNDRIKDESVEKEFWQSHVDSPYQTPKNKATAKANVQNSQNKIRNWESRIIKHNAIIANCNEEIGKLSGWIGGQNNRINRSKFLLGLNPYFINQSKQSSNFMDYSLKRVCFTKWQWLGMLHEVVNY